MKIKDVITLKEVANDLNEGKDFYVVAVLPLRRDPLWIKKKLQKRS